MASVKVTSKVLTAVLSKVELKPIIEAIAGLSPVNVQVSLTIPAPALPAKSWIPVALTLS